jgi:branched-subunit amino acid aminotransferase/4-amino-4-deoxychorismate lyase
MSGPQVLRAEINGRVASIERRHHLADAGYGHFTAMQVRGGRVRGLELHLARLAAASREMFDVEQDDDLIRDHIRHALGDEMTDGSVRVIVSWPDGDDAHSVLVTVRPPGGVESGPQSLRSVPYQRPLPHLKQIGGGFGQNYHRRAARREGFTEALLTGPDGTISEGGVTNVAFFDGVGVVWPDAPALDGITMLLLEAHLPASRRAPVRLADVPSFQSVIITNARGISPVDRVDDLRIPVDSDFVRAVSEVYESVPWDAI